MSRWNYNVKDICVNHEICVVKHKNKDYRYTAAPGENGRFLLKHSVTSMPANVEIDVPLNYADYFYLEALKRRRDHAGV